MQKNFVYLAAFALLAAMISLAVPSMLGDSAIMDEVAHLPAGYSYIEKQDMRINPEHPPLVKDLAGGMVWLWSKTTGKTIAFPDNLKAWTSDINGQWDFGFDFMYKEGNDADTMLNLGRVPTLLLLLILGIYIFKWASELFGPYAGLLSLFLFSFSPTFLAHGRFVTTDVGASAGIFIASYYFVRWLKKPTWINLTVAGIIFGIAQLLKFSCFLLVPLFGFIAFVWICIESSRNGGFWRLLFKYIGGAIVIGIIGSVFIIFPVYLFHVANYPIERQMVDTQYILSSFGIRPVANLIIWLSGIPVLRAFAQYGLGLAMVLQRAAGGNTNYFLGQISAAGSSIYFPLMYLIKETLTLHILTLIALLVSIFRFFEEKIWQKFSEFMEQNIDAILMLSFIALYWYSSVTSPLNIGIRHILPTLAFIFILVSGQIILLLKKNAEKSSALFWAKYVLLSALIIWQVYSVVSVYPSFLAYFNEAVGGPANGYKYVTDSNLDWGQDLKRLAKFIDEKNIDKIYVDYFGGAVPSYYLDEKYLSWWGDRSPLDLKQGGWLAVSATYLQGGRGTPVPGYTGATGYYNWLNKFEPQAIIGHSIFVYYIPPNAVYPIAQN